MNNELTQKVIAWGRYEEDVYVAELNALERIAELHELVNDVLSCETWASVGDLIDMSLLEKHLGDVMDGLWISHCEDNELEVVDRPYQWIPDDENFASPSEYEVFWFCEQIDHQDAVNLEDEFFEFGVDTGNVLTGDTWRWTEADLPSLAEVARQLGHSFVERQDLVERCIG